MEANESAKLRKEFYQKKKELSELRSRLNTFGSQKEEAYRQLKAYREKTSSRRDRIRGLRAERDRLTRQVKELKKERDERNVLAKEKSAARKEVDQKRKELLEQVDVGESPAKIRMLIRKLEEKIETEVMPFPHEQQLRKKIKELEAEYKQVEALGEAWKSVNTAAANFAESRRQAEEIHHQVQDLAEQSQAKHEQLVSLLKEGKEYKGEEKLLAEKYLQLKAKFEQAKKEFKEAAVNVDELGKILGEEDKKKFRQKVREKTAEVKEKIRKKKKLSTEDILAFQAMDE
ncbi:MAG: hypothetical protein AB1668_01340 [Nanoarchaeota archaeon]